MASILERNKNAKPVKKTRADYAEDALYREVWEEVNNEKTQRFIKKYYRHIIGVAAAVMIVVVGIQIGLHLRASARHSLAVNYETALGNLDANALAAMGKNAGGATADLALFQAYVLDKDVAKIEQLAEHGHVRDLRDLARLHVVANRGDEMTPAELEKYLGPLNTKSSPYYYLGAITIAQKYIAAGDKDTASKWLNKIVSDPDAPASLSGAAAALR